jgi:transcriptional regulator with XRE-family HTH domain
MLDKFAEELREARNKKNISLQQMAAKTRIDIKFLEALDNGNFSFLPELYVKAFIKQYSRVVGLNEEESLKKYELAREGKLYNPVTEPEKPQVKEEKESFLNEIQKSSQPKIPTFTDVNVTEKEKTQESSIKIKPVYAGAGFLVILLVVAYFMFFDKGSKIVVEEKPYEEVLEQTNIGRFKEEPKPEDTKQISAGLDSLVLQVANVDSSDSAWVLVIYDDVVKGDFLLFPRSTKTIKAGRLFRVTFGNSGVIRLTLNKNKLPFEARRGSVRHYKIDSNGIERLYSPPTLMQ